MYKANLTRDEILASVNSILSQRSLSKEDSARAEGLLKLADQLNPSSDLLRQARMTQIALQLGQHDPAHVANYRSVPGVREHPMIEAGFDQAIRYGAESLDDEVRALSVGTDSAGGYLSPVGFSDTLYSMMKVYDPLFNPDVVTLVESDSGQSFPVPMLDDTASVFTIISENAGLTVGDIGAFSQLLLAKAPSWKSDMQQVSMELLQDAGVDIVNLLATAFGIQAARGIGPSNLAVITAGASLGKAGTTGQTTTVIYDDLCDLIGSIDPAYIASPKCGWLMRFATLVFLMKIKASTGGSPMLEFDAGQWILFGKPVFISPSVPAMGASAKSIYFGDLSKLLVRLVKDSVRIKRFAETYAEKGLIGFSAFLRTNAGFLKATSSDSPVKWYANSAT